MSTRPYLLVGSPNIEFLVTNESIGPVTQGILDLLGPGKHDLDRLRMTGPEEYHLRATVGRTKRRFHVYTRAADISSSGSVLNIGVGLRRANIPVVLCGAFANPEKHPHASLLLNTLEEEGIRVLPMERASTPYSFVVPPNAKTNESTVLIFKLGYPISTPVRMHTAAEGTALDPLCIIASGIRIDELNLVKKLFLNCEGAERILIPSRAILKRSCRKILHSVLDRTDLLQMNEEETELFLGELLPKQHLSKKLMQRIARRSRVANIIITQAGVGATVLINDEYLSCDARTPEVIRDTSGGGDGFLVGYLWAKRQGYKTSDCLNVASFFASCVIADLGSNKGMPRHDFVLQNISNILHGE